MPLFLPDATLSAQELVGAFLLTSLAAPADTGAQVRAGRSARGLEASESTIHR